MDNDTKDFSELDLEDEVEDDDNTKDINTKPLQTVNEQIKIIKEEQINDKIDEIKEEQNSNKKLSKVLIILIVIFSILFIILICYLLFFKNNNNPIEPTDNKYSKIIRPSNNIEYTILKDNEISFICNKTESGEKITTLKKGMIIECDLNINAKENINELYFDLDNSANLKIKKFTNDSEYELIDENNTFLIKSETPFNTINDKLKFYYEVTDIAEKTGYAEIKNIVLKDNQNIYYKMTNSICAFPPEYNDKIFIYKQTQDNETNYIGSKITLNDGENIELIDTYKCTSEECEVKNNYKNNFIIYDDNKLLIYDVLLRVKQTIRINEEKFDYNKYEYEAVSNKNNELIGILFKSDYVSNIDCNTVLNNCIETSISGYKNSYYSLNKNMFTIALDYGFIGANVYTDYDKALLLYKDNKYGVFSYEEDNMILELSKNYTSIEYDSKLNVIKLGSYDKKSKVYYYKYYDVDNNVFKIDINNKNVKSINNSKVIYYVEEINRQGKKIYSLFNSKGEALKDIPYTLDLNIEIIDKQIAVKNNDDYDLYDLDGNFSETSPYVQSGLTILKTSTSYYLALDSNNSLILTDNIGKTITSIIPSKDIEEIYDIDTMNIVKFEEKNKEIELIITNYNIAVEDKNAYKFIIDSKGKITFEYINYSE